MLRALGLAIVLCLSFEMSGLAAICGDSDCSDQCPTDASGGQCAPNCSFCGCCSLPRGVKPTSPSLLPVTTVKRAELAAATDAPPSPEPADILHIPKPLLA